ncbi:MAG: FtsW/RodA/SpoVE family cell cycle protein, partial [Chloroflexota bacterium]
IAAVAFTLFFVAGADWRQIAVAGVLGAVVFGILAVTLPHAAARVQAWRDVLRDPNLAIWQVQQAFIALGSGGLFGVGLGESAQKFGALPAAHTDGAFAILGEELGLFGCLVVIGLLALLIWRGVQTARKAHDSYGFLLAMGITVWLAYQSLINIAVITAVIPFTGIPLPFLSYGGTSLAVTLAGVGILLNVSRDATITKKVQSPGAQQSVSESLREDFDMRWRHGRSRLPGLSRRR